MSKIRINDSFIFKRSACLNSNVITESSAEKMIDSILMNLYKIAESGKLVDNDKTTINRFFKSINNYQDANRYISEVFQIMSVCHSVDKNFSENLVEDYKANILPYQENCLAVKEYTNQSSLGVKQKESILELVNQYIIADRIMNNHKIISEKCDIDHFVSRLKSRDYKTVIENFCAAMEAITAKYEPYIKFNFCLEELYFLNDSNRIDLNKADILESVTEYFLTRSLELPAKELERYRRVIKENCYLEEEDTAKIRFIYPTDDNMDANEPSIKTYIERFLLLENKQLEDIYKLVLNCCSTTTLDFIYNSNKLIWLLWLLFRNLINGEDSMKEFIPSAFNDLLRRAEMIEIKKSELEILVTKYTETYNTIVIGSEDGKEYCLRAGFFRNELNTLIGKLDTLKSMIYSDQNIESIRFVNFEGVESIPLSEFKVFKFHNLIRASINLDKYLKYKAQNICQAGTEKAKKVAKKLKSILFNEDDNTLYSAIGEDAKADLCISQFLLEKDEMVEANNLLTEICKEANHTLDCDNMDSIRCYYIINPGYAEIHIKESTPIALEEAEWKLVRESETPTFDLYFEQLAIAEAYNEIMEEYSESGLDELLNSIASEEKENYSLEQCKIIADCLAFLGIEKGEISAFGKKYIQNYALVSESSNFDSECSRNIYNFDKVFENIYPNSNSDIEWQINAIQILEAIAPKTDRFKTSNNKNQKSTEKNVKDNNENSEKVKKNPFAGINLNTMRLYLEGLKKKAKDMSQKEKEISRNLDNSFRLFVKGMKNALVSDRREAIIKGSVIPSFSRCIKIAIGLAGVGVVTGNPVVPLMIAIGGFACSKRLTQKERILLLDEIETELQVVDKEISMAEGRNQMKKYRTLLNYKKNLQRQYQRIRYNIRVGRDILPDSAAGIRNSGGEF